MNLSTLKPIKGSVKGRKRVGRGHGSGLGKSSGRGDKGARQRSGFKRRPWFEGGQMSLARRLPKKGFTNIFKKEFQIININSIDKLDEEIVTASVLQERGLVKSLLIPIKILGEGSINKKIIIEANSFSASAKKAIEKAGGTFKVL
ncbi:MAG: 50S ribosomal protein L15 [Candidatus Neomarinimicrobiota bacterium]